MLYVVSATSRHTRWLGRFLREADRVEIAAATNGRDPTAVLEDSRSMSSEAYTVILDRVPVGIFGVVPFADRAAIWLLGSELMVSRELEFLRGCREFFTQITTRHPHCVNNTHADNVVHHKWLRWLGCKFGDDVLINGHRFRSFSYVRTSNDRIGGRGRGIGRGIPSGQGE